MLAIASLSSYEKFANKRQHRDVKGLKQMLDGISERT